MFLTVHRKTTKLLRKMIKKYPGINDLEFTKLYFTKHITKVCRDKGKAHCTSCVQRPLLPAKHMAELQSGASVMNSLSFRTSQILF